MIVSLPYSRRLLGRLSRPLTAVVVDRRAYRLVAVSKRADQLVLEFSRVAW